MKARLTITICTMAALIFLMNLFVSWKKIPVYVNPSDIRQSVDKSFSLLEKSGYLFTERSRFKCAGCHHTTDGHGRRLGKGKGNSCHRFVFGTQGDSDDK